MEDATVLPIPTSAGESQIAEREPEKGRREPTNKEIYTQILKMRQAADVETDLHLSVFAISLGVSYIGIGLAIHSVSGAYLALGAVFTLMGALVFSRWRSRAGPVRTEVERLLKEYHD